MEGLQHPQKLFLLLGNPMLDLAAPPWGSSEPFPLGLVPTEGMVAGLPQQMTAPQTLTPWGHQAA